MLSAVLALITTSESLFQYSTSIVRLAASQLSWCWAQLFSGAWVVNGTWMRMWSGRAAGVASVPGPTVGTGWAWTLVAPASGLATLALR